MQRRIAKMDKMRIWLKRQGFGLEVAPGCRDEVDFGAKTVRIDGRHSYQIKLASLIHECGHVDIFKKRLRSPKERICGGTLAEHFMDVGRGNPAARASRLATLQEEMEAWDAGQRLVKRLAVRYKRSVFEKDRVRCLMTYVAFTASRMRMSKEEQTVRVNLHNALESLVKFTIARVKKRSLKKSNK